MASKPLRPCLKPGCAALTRDGWCQKHKPKHTRGSSGRYHALYSTRIWTGTLRPAQLLREPYCRACARRGIKTKATVVDHVVPHEGRWELFADPANLQSLCKSCHDRKTALEQLQKSG